MGKVRENLDSNQREGARAAEIVESQATHTRNARPRSSAFIASSLAIAVTTAPKKRTAARSAPTAASVSKVEEETETVAAVVQVEAATLRTNGPYVEDRDDRDGRGKM